MIRYPQEGGEVLRISSNGDDRMGANIKPKKTLGQEMTPKKSPAEFASLKNFRKVLKF